MNDTISAQQVEDMLDPKAIAGFAKRYADMESNISLRQQEINRLEGLQRDDRAEMQKIRYAFGAHTKATGKSVAVTFSAKDTIPQVIIFSVPSSFASIPESLPSYVNEVVDGRTGKLAK